MVEPAFGTRAARLLVGAIAALAALRGVAHAAGSFVLFESGQVRPLALSPDGTRLFAVNTPDNRLEIFTVGTGSLTHTGSVSVGLEPVAVAARTNGEVWVVNHLSDSVSIVDVASAPPHVVRTLLVGDEPRDIVFAGPGGNRAFITTAQRGQNIGFDPKLTTPGQGRADVWVFDALALGSTLGGTPLQVIKLFGDTPRALAVAPGGGTVYAAVFHSGNQTATVHEGAVCNGGASAGACVVGGVTMPGGLPAPNTNFEGFAGPETSLIVKYNPSTSHWEDRLGRNWTPAIKFTLPDKDVFAINASTLAQTGFYAGVGTIIYNLAVNPVSGKVYASNTDAHNEVRFEGPGVFGGSTVRGHLHEARISVLSGASTVTPRHLNKHIDYGVVPSLAGVAAKSLSTPVGMAVTSDGATLYVAAFGSGAVGIFDTAQLEADTFTPSASSHIALSGGGPSGVVLDEARSQLYVLTRFDDAISVVDTTSKLEVAHVPVYNPEPPSIVAGRPFLYDASYTSSNGEASCSSCHVFGDFDSLAWDLGNPDGTILNDPNPRRVSDPIGLSYPNFHPLKGPMATQSLRGMANNGPMHWRGDRTAGNDPGGDPLDEDGAFKKFNVAFDGLLGRGSQLTAGEMQAFTNFILQVTYPPNPNRALDNSLTPDQQAGHDKFTSGLASDVFEPCDGCHALDRSLGHFGTDGFSTFDFETQFLKIPHLRNLYQKVGMFGMTSVPFFNAGDNGNKGDQVRGFGFTHDGSCDTLFRFHNSTVFNQTNPAGFPISNPGGFLNTPTPSAGDPERRQMEQFMLAFDSDLFPIVGQQVTLTATNAGAVSARIGLILQRANAGECDVVVKGRVDGEQRGWVMVDTATFQSDRGGEPTIGDTALRALASVPGQELTYTAVPPGSGVRIGIDRDEDGFYDTDETDLGSDPADPLSVPSSPTTTIFGTTTTTTLPSSPALIATRSMTVNDDVTPPIETRKKKITFRSEVSPLITTPSPGSGGDPRLGGAVLEVFRADPVFGPERVTMTLAPANWTLVGRASSFGYRYRGSDPEGPIKSLVVSHNKITFRGGRANWAYTLDEPYQLKMGMRLTLGDTAGWCTSTVPKISRGHTLDYPGRFVGLRLIAPATCFSSPSGAFLDELR